jgi:hypothetical protein
MKMDSYEPDQWEALLASATDREVRPPARPDAKTHIVAKCEAKTANV